MFFKENYADFNKNVSFGGGGAAEFQLSTSGKFSPGLILTTKVYTWNKKPFKGAGGGGVKAFFWEGPF